MCFQINCKHNPLAIMISQYNSSISSSISTSTSTSNTDALIYVDNYYHTEHLPIIDVEYLRILDSIRLNYEKTGSMDYIIGIIISVYSIYRLIIEIIRTIRTTS
jgi:hypothetical protein